METENGYNCTLIYGETASDGNPRSRHTWEVPLDPPWNSSVSGRGVNVYAFGPDPSPPYLPNEVQGP